MICDSSTVSHRRFNPLLNSWVLVSPNRITRPWTGQIEKTSPKTPIPVDEKNSLKPNAIRSNGVQNPDYNSIFIFKNDFPALMNEDINETNICQSEEFNFFQNQSAKGDCTVMCFHPDSNVTLATMEIKEVIKVIEQWKEIINDLGSSYEWVQIFENRGAMMGCSNPHPHCQIWSTNYLPNIPKVKDENLLNYYSQYKSPMLFDYCCQELIKKDRIVVTNDNWICLVPYWAEWPFETMILSRNKSVHRFTDLNPLEIDDLAKIMQTLLQKYNGLFDCEFPYSMGWHGAPTGNYLASNMEHWSLHAIYYPPLLRSATVRKFFVGFELLAETQRDLTPEKAAEILRNVQI